MNEKFRPPETPRDVTREEVIEAYRPFVEQGITSPDTLDLDDPAVREANRRFYEWCHQEDAKSAQDPEAVHRVDLDKTMFYVDAGFTDPMYLQEVLSWLSVDIDDIAKDPSNPDRVETRNQMAAAIHKVRTLLEKQREDSL